MLFFCCNINKECMATRPLCSSCAARHRLELRQLFSALTVGDGGGGRASNAFADYFLRPGIFYSLRKTKAGKAKAKAKSKSKTRITVSKGALGRWGYSTKDRLTKRRSVLRDAVRNKKQSARTLARALMARANLNQNRSPALSKIMASDARYLFTLARLAKRKEK